MPPPPGIVHLGVERPRQPLAQVPRRKADHARGAGRCARRTADFTQPLQIERDVVPAAAQLANRGEERRAASGAAIVDDQPPIDDRHQIEDLAMLRADQPVDARRRKRPAQRRRDGNRVDDVAERAEPDDEEAGHAVARLTGALSAIASAVRPRDRGRSGSLASPTIAVRPPYAETTARSGTVSTV